MAKNKNLIYDVGMHKGEDTEYYLKKGFKVIAFEANPDLVKLCKYKFVKQIKEGKLIIVEGAIIDFDYNFDSKNSKIIFYKNKDLSVWGTADINWAKRNERKGTENEVIEVPKINFKECLDKYGIPYYLKIDIEGMDKVCLKSLISFVEKPDYISIESEKVSFLELKEEFNLLVKNGYDKFKIINQGSISKQSTPENTIEGLRIDYDFQPGSTGLFGNDLPGKWLNYYKAILKYRLIFFGYKLFGDNGIVTNRYFKNVILKIISIFIKQRIPGWYDTHAMHNSMKTDFVKKII